MKLSEFSRKLPDFNSISDMDLKVKNLKLVLSQIKKINLKSNRHDKLKLVIQSALEISGCTRGAIMILNNGELEFKTGLNLNEKTILEREFNISYSICSEVLKTGKSVFLEKAQADNEFSPTQSILSLNLQTIFCSPLIAENEKIGVLYTDCQSLSSKNMDAVQEYFEMFAEHAAIALQS